ncbi:MAG TPA: LssY C-terminal domain-containing protein [Candidatus Acidoferrum sp.]|nr:LssY C-terminal domain-containing protein [Candidatus Acidoferrum sp.]
MNSKASFGTFRGSVFFLIFLSSVTPTLGQSAGDASSPQTQQPAATTDTKSAVPADSSKVIQTKSFTLEGSKVWVDTGISLEPGQRFAVTSEGSLRYSDAKADNGPDGLTRGFKDLIRILPYNGAGRGAVIGRIGDADIAQPFVLGAKKEIVAPVSGKLALGINQSEVDAGTGSYTVTVQVYAADSSTPREIAKEVASIPGVDNRLFEKIPRRIGDKDGNAGDMVNFLILGDEDQMKKVFTTAGWVKVDAGVPETVLAGFIASMSKESYLTMPMSPLYLFGRPQDYGWAHAEPITVVASRNHLRVWKAPFTVNGQMLWVGAATHDIGFEKDQRNNGLTHKIDPDIDLEKDYVQKTLSSTGLVAEVTHFTPKQPMLEAKTATGGSFHSNGQVLVMKLSEAAKSTTASNKN